MALENRLGITDSAELARAEERISKGKALELFESGQFAALRAGSVDALLAIHQTLFSEIYDFAGKVRTVNTAKGNFRFAPAIYLAAALESIEKMPQSTFDEILEQGRQAGLSAGDGTQPDQGSGDQASPESRFDRPR